jgi:hypothetical protein
MLAFSGVGVIGGNLARGFIDASYNAREENNADMATTLETVIGQKDEPYFSLLRQQI